MARVLILHASCGGGHRAAARALATAFTGLDPSTEVSVVDALDGMSAGFRKIYRGAFDVAVSRLPLVYAAFFRASKNLDLYRGFRAARRVSSWLSAKRLAAAIRRARPDAIVCTHFLPLDVSLREKRRGRIEAPVYGVVTDYTAHGLWRQRDADLTFAPPGRAVNELFAGGVPGSRIVATGIPIDPAFGFAYDPLEARRRVGLPLDRPVVVLLAGGSGHGPLAAVAEEVSRALGQQAELVVVCGKNDALLASLGRLRLPGSVRLHGFVEEIRPLLQAATVVVTKPGGLTTSECLALGKPLVFYTAAPGQESANARYVVERGAAVDGGTPAGAALAACRLVADAAARERLARRALGIARPEAARAIAESILLRRRAETPLVLAAI
jgi:processive 1,2-diacylglycerol beta-glucosyltransferase